MSDDEIELRARDAEARRRQMVSGKSGQLPTEESLHPTTDKEFKQRYGGSLYQEENNNPEPVQPTNVQVQKRENVSRKKRKRIGFFQEGTGTTTQTNNTILLRGNRNNHQGKSSAPKDDDEPKGLAEKSLDLYGKTAGRVLITTAHAWTLFIYLTFQIWLGIIAAVSFGLVFAIEYYVGSGVTKTAFDAMMASIGVDWDFYLVALLFYMVVVAICYIQLFGVAMQAKTLGLHPLGGSGAFLKTGTFLLCLVLYWVPIINCLPLVNLYILSIQTYPR